MKKIILILMIGSLIMSSCKKEEQVENSNPTTNPTTDVRDQFIGAYTMTDSVFARVYPGNIEFTNIESYILNIEKKTGTANQVWLIGYQNEADTLFGTIAGNNLSIPNQIIASSNIESYESDGLAELSGSTLKLNTKFWNGGDYVYMRGIGAKQ